MPVPPQRLRRSAVGAAAGQDAGRPVEAARPSWLPAPAGPAVSLVTASSYVREEVARIASAAAVPVHAVSSFRELAAAEVQSGTVLVGSDVTERSGVRASVVLVGLAGEGDGLWELAAELGAERVAVLPEAAGWLAEYLSQLGAEGASGHMLGVVGACGGAGASTLSIWLAQAAAGAMGTLLVDADPWGGGLDTALGLERAAGIRWDELAAARGSINPAQLQQALPAAGGFSLLSFGAGRQDPLAEGSDRSDKTDAGADRDAVGAGYDGTDRGVRGHTEAATGFEELGTSHEVLDAARRGYGLTVLDVGRNAASLDTAVRYCQSLILVLPASVRAAAAGRRLVERTGQLPLSVVVRGPLLAGSDAHLVAESVGFPLSAYWKPMRGLRAAAEGGRVLEYGNGRAGRRLTSTLLRELPSELWTVSG